MVYPADLATRHFRMRINRQVGLQNAHRAVLGTMEADRTPGLGVDTASVPHDADKNR